MRRSVLIVSLSVLLLWAGGLRVWYGWVDAHQGRFYDERYTMYNLEEAVVDENFLRPDNAFYPGLSWLPLAVVYGAADTWAELSGEARWRTFQDGAATPTAYRLGRLLSTLYGLLALLVLYRIGSVLFDPAIGLLAAVMLAATPMHVWLSGMIKPETVLELTLLLAVWLALRAAEHPSLARFLVAGAGVGLALSAKYNGGPVALCLVTLTAVLVWQRQWRAVGWLVAAGVAALVVFAVFNPWLVTSPDLFGAAYDLQMSQYHEKLVLRGDAPYLRQLLLLLEVTLGRLGHGHVLGLLGLVALPVLAWRARSEGLFTLRGRGLLMILSFLVGYVVLYTASSGGNLREWNWFVLLPWTSLGAAWLLAAAWRALGGRLSILRRPVPTALVAALITLAVAWRVSATTYRGLLPSTMHVATIIAGNRLAPDFDRLLVSAAPPVEARLRRGGSYLGFLEVDDFETVPHRLDAADVELFPASRLNGPNRAFYRRRMERVDPEAQYEVRSRLFRVHGPSLIGIVHGWRREGGVGSGTFETSREASDTWHGTLPEGYRGRVVSLELRLPRPHAGARLEAQEGVRRKGLPFGGSRGLSLDLSGLKDSTPRLDADGAAVECARLSRQDAHWVYFRCLRFLTPDNGVVCLRTARPREPIREIAYAVRAWSRPPSLRRGVPAVATVPASEGACSGVPGA
ncbi:MAG: ArnT family glycosyltransferase [Thermoanaerobaculia bacterium]